MVVSSRHLRLSTEHLPHYIRVDTKQILTRLNRKWLKFHGTCIVMKYRGTQYKTRNTIKDAINLCVDGRYRNIGLRFGGLGQTPCRE